MRNRSLTIFVMLFFILSIASFGFPISLKTSYYPEESYYIASNGYDLAYDGVAGPDSSQGNYTLTWDDEMTNYNGIKDTAGEAYVILNFSTIQNFGGFNYSVMHGAYNDDDGNSELWVYDWMVNDWQYLGEGGKGIGGWTNGSISGSKYNDGTEILIMANSTDSDGQAGVAVQIAWLEIFTGPPWLDGYNYRTEIYLNASTGAGTDYILKWRVEYGGGGDGGQIIYCTGHCQTDFGDVRWTEDDGITELSYYLDEYTSSGTPPLYFDVDATFYVRISDDLDSDQIIYIYYGTSGTSTTTSNGPNTFYEWLDADDTDGWTKSHMTVTNYGGYLRFYNPTTTNYGYAYRADMSYPSDQWRMLIRMNTISLGTTDRALIATYDGFTSHIFSEFEAPAQYDQNYYAYWNGSSPLTHGLSWVEGDEYVTQITVDESQSSNGVDYQVWYSGMGTHGLYQSNEFRTGSPTHADGISIGDRSTGRNLDARVKYFAIMPNIDSEPFANDYGPEEYSGAFTTTTTATTTTRISELWGFNTAFIILGLVMIPASGLYLVYGGRKNLSSDKLFYALIAFFIGWSLLVGVIMP